MNKNNLKNWDTLVAVDNGIAAQNTDDIGTIKISIPIDGSVIVSANGYWLSFEEIQDIATFSRLLNNRTLSPQELVEYLRERD